MLDRYKIAFARLKIDRVPERWSEATNKGAPHKAFLLLAIMDLIAQGEITENFIELKSDLLETFDLYWEKVMGGKRQTTIAMPFYHMKSEGFWYLVPIPGQEIALNSPVRSLVRMRQCLLGAKLDPELFALLTVAETRDALRQILIETYFAPQTRPILVEVGIITAQAFAYSRELLVRSQRRFKLRETPEVEAHYFAESRSTGFRRTIVSAYQHTCAICRIRIVTPEGRTAVSAAHIVPWSISHNDDPRNGMALCGLHHWAFDEGVVSIEPSTYRIIVSPVVRSDDEATTPLRTLHDQPLYLPENEEIYPAKEALRWHQKELFRATIPPSLV
ncbi:HNH endonuclease [Candidatus Chloroploca sp. M-50]|uniref:HNH endonuclease n=1 Tax=Candidatus Chloroploca mongolica TaxID=2528176 RepID=A0ABS4DBN3_9CHLR|nr:HNH endonuclease [Candidatus Chloroploca mongolica]MBP1466856.1 HNH endonuclease [Candidatus Chloroploca mongolica]